MDNHSIKKAQQFKEDRFTKIDIIKHKHSTVFLLNFLPNQDMRPHNHPGRELYLLVIEGNGTFSIDGKDLEVNEGDIIYCNPEDQLGFTNTGGKPVSIYATMTKVNK